MKNRNQRRIQASLLAISWLTLTSCDDGESKKHECNASKLESDLDPTPFMGPGADSAGNLQLESGHQYVVSTTYGVPRPGPDGNPVPDSYVQAFGAIQEQLGKQEGLVAYRLSSSESCGSGRTLAVWRSEEEMYAFVVSPAHLNAMTDVNSLLQPGYAVAHYSASDAKEMTFAASIERALAER
jgi:heme-degrading monooxygenase HmoA